MKKIVIGLLAAATLIAPATFANTLAVTGAAAMNGTNFGLEIVSDNSSIAYVQDSTPDSELVYRAEFLFKVNSLTFSGAPSNFRQVIFSVTGPGNPGVGGCGMAAFVNNLRGFNLVIFGGAAQVLEFWMQGAFCGPAAIGGPADSRFFIADEDTNGNGEVKVCFEITYGNPGTGRVSVQDEGDACFSGTTKSRDRNNSPFSAQFVRMGTPALNFFGAGETTEYFFDEFASFRTLAP